jgi:hypothetical protein
MRALVFSVIIKSSIVIKRFVSPLLYYIEGPFPFPYADLSSILMNPEPKIYIFPHIRFLSAMQDAYMLSSPLQPVYIVICARKYKMTSGFHVVAKDL